MELIALWKIPTRIRSEMEYSALKIWTGIPSRCELAESSFVIVISIRDCLFENATVDVAKVGGPLMSNLYVA